MNSPFSLQGKTILVTGASSGIGRSIAIESSKMGASVILTARNRERLDETLSMMESEENHRVICADLFATGDLDSLVDSIDIKLDGIVQCAGFTVSKPFAFVTEDDMRGIMKVNFESPVMLTQKLLKKKRIDKNASVVFISSISGVYCSYVAGGMYSASKGAINGMVKAMAIELAAKSIRVNCVNPGMIDTDILKEGLITKEQLSEDINRYPLKRYGKPEEVAYAVIYLLSDASQWVTGSNLVIDGGYTLL